MPVTGGGKLGPGCHRDGVSVDGHAEKGPGAYGSKTMKILHEIVTWCVGIFSGLPLYSGGAGVQ